MRKYRESIDQTKKQALQVYYIIHSILLILFGRILLILTKT